MRKHYTAGGTPFFLKDDSVRFEEYEVHGDRLVRKGGGQDGPESE